MDMVKELFSNSNIPRSNKSKQMKSTKEQKTSITSEGKDCQYEFTDKKIWTEGNDDSETKIICSESSENKQTRLLIATGHEVVTEFFNDRRGLLTPRRGTQLRLASSSCSGCQPF
ncbi:hypothetical protein V1478_005180 [Vespula squamosa]|uniref:Uncharacterized protein n=1 Tax=Vespula squamosa TaxID=30214 RepID=A0ABD2BDE2_VESSQ